MLKLGPELFELLNAEQRVGNRQPVIYGKGGLSVLQIQLIEAQLGFRIPEDFAFFLQNVRDPGDVLFPWSNFNKQRYDDSITWILKGIEFDIEHNNLWLRRWGERPATLSVALDKATADFATWPKLLPVYGHRFLAAEPCRSDNPVFSIWQTDIVCYGANLAHYLINEFVSKDVGRHILNQNIQKIEIWSDFVDNRLDFLTEGLDADATARTVDSIRKALRRGVNAGQTPAVRIEFSPDGNALVAGQLIVGDAALETKLHQLMQQTPPPDLYFPTPTGDVSPGDHERIDALLRKLNFEPIVVVQRDETGIKAFPGWRLA
jgi:hypothetical protein